VGEEPAVDQKTRVVVDDQKQLGADRGVDLGERDPWSDEHVCDPAFVRTVGLVAAEHRRLGFEGFAMKAPASQLGADGALGDFDAVAVIEDRGDLGSRAARDLEAKGRGLTEQLRVGAHRSGVGALCGL
jgi:hypothetical protein